MYRHIEAYSHNGRIGVLVEVETDTDFTARTPEFRELARDLALQVAAMSPVGIRPIDDEKVVRLWPSLGRGEGREDILLQQMYIKDPDKTVGEHISAVAANLGVPIQVVRFVRFENDET